MESKHGSKNCRGYSTSSQPQSGIFTRRKWQTYLLSQLDASSFEDQQGGLLRSPPKKPKNHPNEFPPKDEVRLSRFPVKDLRIKRVFSTKLTDESRSSVHSEGKVSNKEGAVIANGELGVGKSFEETAQVQDVDVCNSQSCFTNANAGLGDVDRVCNGVSKQFDGKSEELQHSTPPDDEILAREFRGVSSDRSPRSSNGCVEEGRRSDSLSKTRMGLKPCFKRKLFRAPGSIAYKRLLPYLLNNDTCIIQNDPNPKRENDLVKRVNVESNFSNREFSSVDSGICEKRASVKSSNATKPSLPPPGKVVSFVKTLMSGSTETFQNGNPCGNQKYSDLSNDLNLVTESSGEKSNVIYDSSDEKGPTENGGHINSQIEHLSDKNLSKTLRLKMLDGQNSSLSSNVLSEIEVSKSRVEKLTSSGCTNSKREDDFSEGSPEMTFTSEISCKLVAEEVMDEKGDSTCGEDQNPGSAIARKDHSKILIASNVKYDSCLVNKLVRNPLLQLKSFKSQGSINYRRMLPFLEDLIKDNSDNSCALGNIGSPIVEKGLATVHSQPTSSNNSGGFSSGIKPYSENSDPPSMTVLATSNETISETEKSLIPAGGNDKLPTPFNLQKQKLQSEVETVDKCKLGADSELHRVELLNDQAVTSITGEGTALVYEESPMTLEDCTRLTVNVSDNAKLPESISSQPIPSCVGAYVLSENPTNIRKGILKRNPRGCRGICTCLNCSSFRLHAERAFEFSKNQLLDAEEVASDLIKELSCLRGMLEKSADGANDDAGYHINKVKEACRKASEAELNAKDRLVQMNCELDIHCRIACSQRPNVKFSGDIEKDIEKKE